WPWRCPLGGILYQALAGVDGSPRLLMSPVGTTRTCEDARCLTGFGGKADIEPRLIQAQPHLKKFLEKIFEHNPHGSLREACYGILLAQGYTEGVGPSKRRLQAGFICSRFFIAAERAVCIEADISSEDLFDRSNKQ